MVKKTESSISSATCWYGFLPVIQNSISEGNGQLLRIADLTTENFLAM